MKKISSISFSYKFVTSILSVFFLVIALLHKNGSQAFATETNAPLLEYSTYFGGSAFELPSAIAVDNQGFIYFAGRTSSPDFPLHNPLYDGQNLSGDKAFITKINPENNQIIYSTFFGDTHNFGHIGDIIVDDQGNAYIVGSTTSTDLPLVNPIKSTISGASDAFITKLNADGSEILYSTYLGGSNGDGVGTIEIDEMGNIYLGGGTTSTDLPLINPIQSSLAGGADGFIMKLNPSGTELLFASYFGGSASESLSEIAISSNQYLSFIGTTYSSDLLLEQPFQDFLNGERDAFFGRVDTQLGELTYSTYLGGSEHEIGRSIGVDQAGNSYVMGTTWSEDFPTLNAIFAQQQSYEDQFIAKFSPTGVAQFMTYFGSNEDDFQGDMVVDNAGNSYITGSTYSMTFPLVNPIQSYNAGDAVDSYISVLSTDGSTLLFSSYLGGGSDDGADWASAITLNSNGDMYVSGHTEAPNFPLVNPYQSMYGGAEDLYISKIINVIPQQNTIEVITDGPYQVNEGDTITLSATATDTQQSTFEYSWDLDADGIFETLGQSVEFSALNIDGPTVVDIAVTATIPNGDFATSSTQVSVQNVAPVVETISAPSTPQIVGETVLISANFTDSGILDTHTADLDWGDTTTSSGVVNVTNGSGTVTGSHIYSTPGVYTITLTVTDDDTGVGANQFMYVVVYDPNGGFLTGAGRFDTPQGSFTNSPTEEGMTNFGSNAKYVNNELTGSTKLHFKNGQFEFKFDSTNYNWMVVSPDNHAQLQGTGTVNGGGNYSFLLTVTDDTQDSVRIQIRDVNNTLIYDNGLVSLSNGNIKVHN